MKNTENLFIKPEHYKMLKEILRDCNVPFLIDIHEFDKLPESFQKEIEKNYIIFYN